MKRSLLAVILGLLSLTFTSCQDVVTTDYVYSINVTETETLGISEVMALEMSIISQGVSLNASFIKTGTGFGEYEAESDADLKASEFYHLNFNKIIPGDLLMITGKGFNYTLYRLTLSTDPNGHVKRTMIESKRIIKK